jgi:hypothetical protein
MLVWRRGWRRSLGIYGMVALKVKEGGEWGGGMEMLSKEGLGIKFNRGYSEKTGREGERGGRVVVGRGGTIRGYIVFGNEGGWGEREEDGDDGNEMDGVRQGSGIEVGAMRGLHGWGLIRWNELRGLIRTQAIFKGRRGYGVEMKEGGKD